MGGFVMPTGGMPAAAKALLVPENIKTGVQIKGGGVDVTGNFTGDATATEAQILTGQTAYVQGQRIVGSMPDNGAVSQVLPVNGSYAIPAGYHNGEGAITQSVPEQTNYQVNIPMYSGNAITLPAGYYAQAITVTPSYQAGTVITDFSASGPLGNISQTWNATEYYARNGKIYLRKTMSNSSGEAVYGDSCSMNFALPIASGFKYAVISGTLSGLIRLGFADSPTGGLAVQHQMDSSGTFEATVTMGTHRYFRVEAHIFYIDAWGSRTTEVSITSITLYT